MSSIYRTCLICPFQWNMRGLQCSITTFLPWIGNSHKSPRLLLGMNFLLPIPFLPLCHLTLPRGSIDTYVTYCHLSHICKNWAHRCLLSQIQALLPLFLQVLPLAPTTFHCPQNWAQWLDLEISNHLRHWVWQLNFEDSDLLWLPPPLTTPKLSTTAQFGGFWPPLASTTFHHFWNWAW